MTEIHGPRRRYYEDTVFFSRRFWSPKISPERLVKGGRPVDIVDIVVRKATNEFWVRQRQGALEKAIEEDGTEKNRG